MERDFKGVWFPKWLWLSKDLTDREKMFYVEIDSLDKEEGCFASNQHFSELFGISKNRCTEIIKSLEKKGYLSINLERKGKEIQRRILKITPIRDIEHPYSENRDTLFGKSGYPIRKIGKRIIPVNNTKEREERAHEFFKNNFQWEYEKFLMDYQSKIKNFQKFTDTFNDVFDKENLSFELRVIRGRINQFARNWVERQDRNFYPGSTPENLPKPNYTKNAI